MSNKIQIKGSNSNLNICDLFGICVLGFGIFT